MFVRRLLASAIAAAAMATTLVVPPAVAQTTAASARQSWNIPAGPLEDALSAFAAAAGAPLSFEPALVAGKRSNGLRGEFSIDEGFDRLLQGSGLQRVRANDGTYTLRPLPQGAVTLAPVRVSAAGMVANGSVEQGYRSDAVSAVGPWQGRELQDTPYSITVVSKELIENLQATTPDQVFRVNPTTMLSRAQYEIDNPYIMMRGFNISTPYRDGMQGDGYGYGTTTEDAERIEILTGLSGFLYGPGNVGGLVNYVSKRPTAERLNRLTGGSNGGDNGYVHGDFGGPIDSEGRFGYRLNAIDQRGDTAIDNLRIDKTFFSGALDWHITDTLLLQVNGAQRDYEVFGNQPYWSFAPGVGRPSASQLDTSSSYGQPWTWKYSEVNRYGANLQWAASEAIGLRAGWRESAIEGNNQIARNTVQANETYNQVVSTFFGLGVNPMLWDVETSVGSAFADLRFATGTLQHKLTAGVQYMTIEQERFTNSVSDISYTGLPLDRPTYFARPTPAPIDRGARIKVAGSTNTSWILGDDIAIDERWSALIGLARSTIDIDEITGPVFPRAGYRDSAVTPTLSLIYKPAESVTTYASYIESLEAGGIAAEQFGGYPVVNPGQMMDPLTSHQLEVGAKISLGGMLLTAALFEIDKSLQFYDITDPTRPRFVQDGRQVHRGVEFTAIGKATERLTLIGGFTWLDAQVEKQKQNPALEGKRPMQVAEVIAKLRAEYQVPGLPALTLVAGANYTGNQYGDALNTDELPAYTLLDAGARYSTQIAQHPLTLRLEANNLTDKRYWANTSQTGMPRAVVFSVSTEF